MWHESCLRITENKEENIEFAAPDTGYIQDRNTGGRYAVLLSSRISAMQGLYPEA